MHTEYEFDDANEAQLVYVRPVDVSDLPKELQPQAKGRKIVYALHDESGGRLALVADRQMAFMLARQNDMAPVNVH